jgi:hypothetical protein
LPIGAVLSRQEFSSVRILVTSVFTSVTIFVTIVRLIKGKRVKIEVTRIHTNDNNQRRENVPRKYNFMITRARDCYEYGHESKNWSAESSYSLIIRTTRIFSLKVLSRHVFSSLGIVGGTNFRHFNFYPYEYGHVSKNWSAESSYPPTIRTYENSLPRKYSRA